MNNIYIPVYIIYIIKLYFIGSPSIRPIPTDISQWDDNMKKDWLHNQSTSFLQEIFGNTEISQNIIELEKAHQEGFHCGNPQCNIKFPLHSTRVRYFIH
jgi:hypothetical protein